MDRLLIENLATILSITGIIGFVALGPIGRALARRIEGRLDGLDLVERRLAELERSQHRLAELEERVDFGERLLAQRGPAIDASRNGD
jgi:hypothetical protein